MRSLLVVAALMLVASPAYAVKPCEELKAEIEAKLKEKGVKAYTLDIVPAQDVKDLKVVGSCEGGAKKIVYERK